MPRFRAKKDAPLPEGVMQGGPVFLGYYDDDEKPVYGPFVISEGDCVTVTDGEAEILRADAATWEDMDALVMAETIRLRADTVAASKKVAPDNKKVIASSDEAKGSEGDGEGA